MSTWSSWLLGGDKKEDVASEEKEGETKEDSKEDGWTKGLEIAGGWVQSVTSYASTLSDNVKKQVVETTSTGFLGDFQKEQEKFERKQRYEKDAGVAPWVGYNEEDQIRTQVLELSADGRNFLREPPPGVDFPFDYDKVSPIALVMLKEDERLQKMRFELVPKKVSEKSFWRNYFYRISLIKQSVQLSSLSAAESSKTTTDEEREKHPDSSVTSPQSDSKKNEEDVPPSGEDEPVEDFASDQLYNIDTVSKETVKSELTQLGVSKDSATEEGDVSLNDSKDILVDDNEMWDELKAELEELDLGENGEAEGEIPPDWEEELHSMLSDETNDTQQS